MSYQVKSILILKNCRFAQCRFQVICYPPPKKKKKRYTYISLFVCLVVCIHKGTFVWQTGPSVRYKAWLVLEKIMKYCFGSGIYIIVLLKLTFFSLNLFPNKPWFLPVCSTILLKTMWEKEKLLIMSNFSFSHIVFYPFEELSAIFIKLRIVVCKLFQFGRV